MIMFRMNSFKLAVAVTAIQVLFPQLFIILSLFTTGESEVELELEDLTECHTETQ